MLRADYPKQEQESLIRGKGGRLTRKGAISRKERDCGVGDQVVERGEVVKEGGREEGLVNSIIVEVLLVLVEVLPSDEDQLQAYVLLEMHHRGHVGQPQMSSVPQKHREEGIGQESPRADSVSNAKYRAEQKSL